MLKEGFRLAIYAPEKGIVFFDAAEFCGAYQSA
jgi:aryl-alcohol dehydrogenase-like predicted oxidoreductase